MLPLPAATTSLAEIQPQAQAWTSAFLPYGYLEAGIAIGALLILFLVYVFRSAIATLISRFFSASKKYGDYSSKHRDTEATGWAISEHRRFGRLMKGPNKISRYD